MKLPLSFALFVFCRWHEEFQVSFSCYQQKGNTLNIILSVDVCIAWEGLSKENFICTNLRLQSSPVKVFDLYNKEQQTEV